AILARLRREGYDWRTRLRALSVPTLVIHGEEDALPVAVSAELVALLPRAQRQLVPHSGHMPFWEAPEVFFSSVDSFLAAPVGADLDEPGRAAVRKRLRRDEPGTYIGEILQQRDSSLARWPDRDRPLAVWIQPSAAIDDWMPGYVDRVREAFEEWGEVGIPLG